MTDFNDFVVASSNRASPAKADMIPLVIDGSTATGHVTAAQLKLTSEIVLTASNPASAYTLPKTHALVSITGLDHALTINAPASGTSGETQGIEVRVAASGADRVITPSGFTIIGAGSTFTVTSGTTEIFYVQWNGSAWEWSGNLTAAKITNVPAGNIAATTVQAAINELDSEKQPLDATLTALAGLDTVVGAVFQTGTDTFIKYALDTDLSSVSGSDDTVASAKAIKAALDTKDTIVAPSSENDNFSLIDGDIVRLTGGASKTATLPATTSRWSCVVDNASGNSWTIARADTSAPEDSINGSAANDTLTTGKSVTYYSTATNVIFRIGALS